MPGALRHRPMRGCATRIRRRSVVDRAARPDYKPALPAPAPGLAQVAQLVEHATENRSVGGSIPPLGTIYIQPLFRSAISRVNDLRLRDASDLGRQLSELRPQCTKLVARLSAPDRSSRPIAIREERS